MRYKLSLSREGFTFIETVLVIGIIGMFIVVLYPSIMNSLETRDLENSARDIQSTLQRAKFQAVKTKINHRVGFENVNESWFFFIEREDNPGTWNMIQGIIKKEISFKFDITVNFPDAAGTPDKAVVFSPLGFISNFDTNQNNITLKSDKLETRGQPDLRIISVYAGGSIHYIKSESE